MAETKGSIVLVSCGKKLATGVCIANDLVLTVAHAEQPGETFWVHLPAAEGSVIRVGSGSGGVDAEEKGLSPKLKAEKLSWCPNGKGVDWDICLLRVEQPLENVEPAKIAFGQKAEDGDRFESRGFPIVDSKAMEAFQSMRISGTLGAPTVTNGWVYQLTAEQLPQNSASWQGASGAPVFNRQGFLIGYITMQPTEWSNALEAKSLSHLCDDDKCSLLKEMGVVKPAVNEFEGRKALLKFFSKQQPEFIKQLAAVIGADSDRPNEIVEKLYLGRDWQKVAEACEKDGCLEGHGSVVAKLLTRWVPLALDQELVNEIARDMELNQGSVIEVRVYLSGTIGLVMAALDGRSVDYCQPSDDRGQLVGTQLETYAIQLPTELGGGAGPDDQANELLRQEYIMNAGHIEGGADSLESQSLNRYEVNGMLAALESGFLQKQNWPEPKGLDARKRLVNRRLKKLRDKKGITSYIPVSSDQASFIPHQTQQKIASHFYEAKVLLLSSDEALLESELETYDEFFRLAMDFSPSKESK